MLVKVEHHWKRVEKLFYLLPLQHGLSPVNKVDFALLQLKRHILIATNLNRI